MKKETVKFSKKQEYNDNNKEIRGKMDNEKSLKYKLSVQRNWQNNATITRKDF